MTADDVPYQVEARGEKHAVIASGETVILECRDAPSAQHYAEMLNRAWQRGYRAGYKQGKTTAG